jgi:ferredoxin-NADP reductase
MMGEMMGEGHGRSAPKQLYPTLMGLPGLDVAERHRLAREADARIQQGLVLIAQGSAAARPNATPAELEAAGQRFRDGLSLFQSGTAAKGALSDESGPQRVALDWFRSEMNLPAGDDHESGEALFWGFGPMHLFFMALLTLISIGLLALQALRLHRVRELVKARPGSGEGIASLPSSRSADAAVPSPASLAPAASGGSAARRPKAWSGDLRVARIVQETPTVETFRLVEPSSDRLPFDFLPGQFLQVQVEPDGGKPVRRSYTIASSPTQRAYVEVTVKREEQGIVSCYLHDNTKVGDLIKVSGPFGSFTFTGSDADSIVLIAGGVGITPMMSVLRYLTDTAWPGEIFFLYGANSTEEFVFREEIERLERHDPKLHVLATMARSPGTVWLGPEGVITKDLLERAVPDLGRRRIHLCGPPPMMASIKLMLKELGVPDAQVHSEAFGPASLPADNAPEAVTSAPVEATTATGPASPPKRSPSKAGPEVAASTVTFSISGISAALPADQSVLEAAEGAGVEIPFQCRVGECGVCVTRLLEGEVSMAVETGLDPADKAQGYVLACQAKTTGGPLVVEA